ncbi:MAG: glycosyltransferase family 4 protein [bacterium]
MAAHVCVITSVHNAFDGRIFHRESTALAAAGHRVTLVAPAEFERLVHDQIEILGIPRPSSRLQRPLLWLRLAQLVPRLDPDVIHFHDPELLLLVPFFRLVLGRATKLVYDVHEYFVDDVATKYWIPPWLQPVAMRLATWLERRLTAHVDGIVCAVEEQRPLYADQRAPAVVARNLPIARIFEGAEPHPELAVDTPKLIYVGLILPERGIDVLLEAVRILARQERDIKLYLIGRETSPGYMKEIRTFVKANELIDKVHWLGYVPHDKIKHYLANADIGVAPGLRTRQYENPGICTKLFEYMICSLPIVSADHPHRKKYIDECHCGLTVPPQDATAWAEAIAWLLDHPEESQTMGTRGREMVLDHYTWEEEQSRFLAFYESLVDSEDAPGPQKSHADR